MLFKINILCHQEVLPLVKMCECTHTLPIKKSFHFPISGQNETMNPFGAESKYTVSNTSVLVFSQLELLKQLLHAMFQCQMLT